MLEYTGKCHCGNIRYRYLASETQQVLPVRNCSCEFCRRHGAAYTSDPAGRLEIDVEAPGFVQKYRFSTKVVDFLLCTRCGVMITALTRIDGHDYAALNANTLDGDVMLSSTAMDVSAETPEEGEARRKRNWIGRVILKGLSEQNESA